MDGLRSIHNKRLAAELLDNVAASQRQLDNIDRSEWQVGVVEMNGKGGKWTREMLRMK